ncbi:C-reactive protein-like [Synchiropus splendidus]|uniref:C-reactive protein-like n=1 Tax=Synchiropus splendidus TaxID=270530 RepID=UPI00237E89DE|nr:C-reactive protein-like [Synchiropus splendidus]
MKLLLILGILTTCLATPQDLTGKMFTFPRSSITSYVKLFASRTQFSAVTLCQRFLTDLKRDYCYFSLSTSKSSNGFMLMWDAKNKELEVYTQDVTSIFNIPGAMELNMWHSLCTTWESTSGLVQVWLDGQQSPRKSGFLGGKYDDRAMIIVLGQEQDSHGGSFDFNQSFTGMMSDVHMWSKALSPCEIRAYLDDGDFTPGDVINWKGLEFQIFDQVLIENKDLVG